MTGVAEIISPAMAGIARPGPNSSYCKNMRLGVPLAKVLIFT